VHKYLRHALVAIGALAAMWLAAGAPIYFE